MFIIDRFEEDFAVVENVEYEKMLHIKRNEIDENAKEGDVIFFSEGVYKVDIEATEKRRAEILEIMNRLNIKNKTCK